MSRPRLLDLFCGAGGCSVGYHRAGFDVVGVDNRPMPRYPFSFIQADALEYLACYGREYDAIHASPPCQRYSRAAFRREYKLQHPDLLDITRQTLDRVSRSWVIENVDGAPMQRGAFMCCGLMFGLKVFRHRWFESSVMILTPSHPSHRGKLIGRNGFCCVVGHGGGANARMRKSFRREAEGFRDTKADWCAAMGIDWMSRNELSQAIPPAYTEFIGCQLIETVQ